MLKRDDTRWRAQDKRVPHLRIAPIPSGQLVAHPLLYVGAGVLLCFLFESLRTSLLGLLVLCLLMLVYACLAPKSDAANPAEIGDNCYFIGFIFTLVVISVTIFSLVAPDGIPEVGQDPVDSLLRAVAVALGTSVWGMLLRFWFAHQHKDPDQLLEQRMRRISSETARLANSLNSAVSTTDEYAAQVRRETHDLSASLNREFIALIEQFAVQINDKLGQVHFDRVHSELQRAVTVHTQAVEGAKTSMEHIADQFNPIATSIKNSAQNLEQASGQFKKSVGDPDWKQMNQSLHEFANRVSEVGKTIDGMRQHYRRLTSDPQGDLQRMEEMHGKLQQFTRTLQKDIEEITKIKKQYRDKFNEAANVALAETHKLYARLIAGAEIAIANSKKLGVLGDLGEDIRNLTDKIQELNENVKPK